MRLSLLHLALCLPLVAHAASFPPAFAPGGMVAADNAAASAVGAAILDAGGDATDAAAAVALYLGVVQPFASGIGGGGFAVVYRSGGEAFALDFREMAPRGATRDMYLDPKGEVIRKMSTRGPKAAGVPGEVAGLFELHRRHGKLPWSAVVAPALSAARDGFPWARCSMGGSTATERRSPPGRGWPPDTSTPRANRSPRARDSSGPIWPAPSRPSPAEAPLASTKAPWRRRSPAPWPPTGA